MKWIVTLLATTVALGAADHSPPKNDNTRLNADVVITAQDQSNAPRDLEMTARIRKTVVEAPMLSVEAKNIKIISREGRVTLSGPVSNAEEKAMIGDIAELIAGKDRVSNQLTLP